MVSSVISKVRAEEGGPGFFDDAFALHVRRQAGHGGRLARPT
jgi:hypothetical protein